MVLLAVLWLGVVAGLILAGVRHAAMVNRGAGQAALASVQAHWLARAGVEQAIAVLQDDGQADDSPLDLWHHDDALFKDVELATGKFSVIAPPEMEADTPADAPRYGVNDLGGRLNVNDAEAEQLELLSEALPGLAEGVAAGIIDWRDENSQAEPGGAEGTYYLKLPHPYEAGNRPMETLEELRLVKGVDRAAFFGEDSNLNGVLDAHENDGPVNAPEDDADGKLDVGLAGLVTIYSYEPNENDAGAQRLNVNEASASQLRSRLKFSQGLAEAVAARRNGNYRSLMQLLDVRPEQGRSGRGGGAQERPKDDEITQVTLDWLGANLGELSLSDDERLPARINVNTAPREVLLTLPKMTESAADAIVRHRTSDPGPFETVGELRSSGCVDDDLFKSIAEKTTVRSMVFALDAIGTSKSGVRQRLTVVVDRKDVPAKVLYWRQGAAW